MERLKSSWPAFKKSALHKKTLQNNLKHIEERIAYFKEWNRADEAADLQHQHTLLTNELTNVSQYFVKLEDGVIPECLQLPNKLHPDTPVSEDVVVCSFTPPNAILETDFHHLQVGSRLTLVEYRDPISVFLIDDAAIFELATLKFFLTELEAAGYLLFSNPDIVTNVTVEGCGYDSTDPYQTFILDNDDGHLVGGASLFPFCAYSARMSGNVKFMPERRFSVGRQYAPPSDRNHDGLYTAAQRNAVHAFVTTKQSSADEMIEFENVLKIVKGIYDQIGLNYRITYSRATNLERGESLRANIELYSPYRRTYVNVGNISRYDDYISRRLFMYYHVVQEYNFSNVISGTLVNVSKLLACLLEYTGSENNLFIPDCIKRFMC